MYPSDSAQSDLSSPVSGSLGRSWKLPLIYLSSGAFLGRMSPIPAQILRISGSGSVALASSWGSNVGSGVWCLEPYGESSSALICALFPFMMRVKGIWRRAYAFIRSESKSNSGELSLLFGLLWLDGVNEDPYPQQCHRDRRQGSRRKPRHFQRTSLLDICPALQLTYQLQITPPVHLNSLRL